MLEIFKRTKETFETAKANIDTELIAYAKRSREDIDRQLKIYEKEKLTEILLDIAKAQEDGAKQERDYECKWHESLQIKNTKLAELDARIASREEVLKSMEKNYSIEYSSTLKAKDQTIEILNNRLKELIEKIGQGVNQTFN